MYTRGRSLSEWQQPECLGPAEPRSANWRLQYRQSDHIDWMAAQLGEVDRDSRR